MVPGSGSVVERDVGTISTAFANQVHSTQEMCTESQLWVKLSQGWCLCLLTKTHSLPTRGLYREWD